MSLINQALKKAQQVQTESEATSAVATQASSSLSTPSATGSGQSDIFKILLGVMMFTIIITSFIAFLVISIMDRNSEGGQIVVGGDIPTVNGECASGWYFSPTVIEQLSQDSILNQEEIFGPVVTLSEFDQENDVIEMANNTSYGLASIIWTEDIDRAHKLAEVVESGLVWVNCWLERDLRTPFGGIKNSGFGKEGGKYALDFFTEPKNICTKYYD